MGKLIKNKKHSELADFYNELLAEHALTMYNLEVSKVTLKKYKDEGDGAGILHIARLIKDQKIALAGTSEQLKAVKIAIRQKNRDWHKRQSKLKNPEKSNAQLALNSLRIAYNAMMSNYMVTKRSKFYKLSLELVKNDKESTNEIISKRNETLSRYKKRLNMLSERARKYKAIIKASESNY